MLISQVNGNPRPSVEWTRLDGDVNGVDDVKHSLTNMVVRLLIKLILSFLIFLQGSVLTLHGVTRAASGVYMCRASNGVGQPATEQVRDNLFCTPVLYTCTVQAIEWARRKLKKSAEKLAS